MPSSEHGLPPDHLNPWANDGATRDLYRRRCRRQAAEMTCAAQAAEILAPLVSPGETLLDVGCAGGYYYWSFHDRGLPVTYYGLDHTRALIGMAREEMGRLAGLPPERFILGAAEYLDRAFDTIVCFNTLTNNPHYAEPLERLLDCAGKRLLLRESLGPEPITRYTPDPYLDPSARHIHVYHNTYAMDEVTAFIEGHGFSVRPIPDRRTGDGTEMVVDIPHTWRILLASRVSGTPSPDPVRRPVVSSER